MNIFSRQKLTSWVIAVLILINLLTLGTLWYLELLQPHRPFPPRDEDLRQKQEERFRREVGLDDDQSKLFNQKNDEFFLQTNPKKRKVHQLNSAIMNEAFSETPDMEKIQKWVDEIATIEKDLSIHLFEHIKSLVRITRPEQKEKLQIFYNDLFKHMEPPRPPEKPELGE